MNKCFNCDLWYHGNHYCAGRITTRPGDVVPEPMITPSWYVQELMRLSQEVGRLQALVDADPCNKDKPRGY